MVGHFPADDLRALGLALAAVILASELHRGLDGLGTRIDEERGAEVAGRQFGDQGGRLDRGRVGHAPVGRVGQRADLIGGRLRDVASTVSHVDAEETGEAVEITVALRVDQIASFAADEDGKIAVPGRLTGEMGTEVPTGTRPQLVSVHGFLLRF